MKISFLFYQFLLIILLISCATSPSNQEPQDLIQENLEPSTAQTSEIVNSQTTDDPDQTDETNPDILDPTNTFEPINENTAQVSLNYYVPEEIVSVWNEISSGIPNTNLVSNPGEADLLLVPYENIPPDLEPFDLPQSTLEFLQNYHRSSNKTILPVAYKLGRIYLQHELYNSLLRFRGISNVGPDELQVDETNEVELESPEENDVPDEPIDLTQLEWDLIEIVRNLRWFHSPELLLPWLTGTPGPGIHAKLSQEGERQAFLERLSRLNASFNYQDLPVSGPVLERMFSRNQINAFWSPIEFPEEDFVSIDLIDWQIGEVLVLVSTNSNNDADLVESFVEALMVQLEVYSTDSLIPWTMPNEESLLNFQDSQIQPQRDVQLIRNIKEKILRPLRLGRLTTEEAAILIVELIQ